MDDCDGLPVYPYNITRVLHEYYKAVMFDAAGDNPPLFVGDQDSVGTSSFRLVQFRRRGVEDEGYSQSVSERPTPILLT